MKALGRAGIKIKYSGGYNPKPKINFSPPTPLGIESLAEYGDIIITQDLEAGEFSQRVNLELKELNHKVEKIKLVDSKKVCQKVPSLMEDISVNMYHFELIPVGNAIELGKFVQNVERNLKKDYTFSSSFFGIKVDMQHKDTLDLDIVSLDVLGYVKVFKNKNNDFFKFNHFLDFFHVWIKNYGVVISNVTKKEAYVFRDGFLKTPLEVV